jgi:hypothetical protein
MALPKLHPLTKTELEVRRGIQRLENHLLQSPEESEVKNGNVQKIIDDLNKIRHDIPKHLWESDDV